MPHVKLSKEFASGVTDTSIAAGPNGYVLTVDTAAVSGFNWTAPGGGGGGVVSVSGGTNISVTGTATNPIVNVSSPLTNTLDIGTQIVSSTSTGSINFDNTITKANITSGMIRLQDSTNVGINTSITRSLVSVTNTTTGGMTSLTSDGLTQLGLANPLDINPSAGNDLNMNVSGVGRVHIIQGGTGGATQPAISVENNNGNADAVHLDLYKNSSSPAAADGLATLSFHGNSSTGVKTEYAKIAATIVDPTNASQNSSLSLSACVNSATPTAFLTCDGTGSVGYVKTNKSIDTLGNPITTSSGSINLYQALANQNVGLTNVANGGSIILNKSGGGGGSILLASQQNIGLAASDAITLSSSASGISMTAQPSTGILTNQNIGGRTILRTGLGSNYTDYVDYYPAVHMDNGNNSTAPVYAPKIPYQTLTILNNGVLPLYNWIDISPTNWNAPSVFAYHPASNTYWIAYNYGSSQSIIYITTDLVNTAETIELYYSSSGSGITKCNCMYASGNYMYIGGDFAAIGHNGGGPNATAQFGFSAVYTGSGVGSFYEDPIYDGASGNYGVNGYVNTISQYGSEYVVGGLFSSLNGTGNPLYNVVLITANTGGSASYQDFAGAIGTNGEVFCSCTYGADIYIGGYYSQTYWSGGWLYSTAFFGAYNVSGNYWVGCDGNNFNAPVYVCGTSTGGAYIFAGGSFTQNALQYCCYIDATSPSSTALASGISGNGTFSHLNCFSNSGGFEVVIDDSTRVFRTSGFQSWSDLGQSNSGYITSGLVVKGFNEIYTSQSNYQFIRAFSLQSQQVAFQAQSPCQFRYSGTTYNTATLTSPYTAQQFISEGSGSNYWYPVGNPICSFS